MNYDLFIKKINNHKLSPAEKSIAEYLSKNFSAIPFCTIKTICDETKVGKATVGRFLNKLGFTGFTYFQMDVNNSLQQHNIAKPIEIIEQYQHESHAISEQINEHFEQVITNTNKMHNSIDSKQITKALALLGSKTGKLYIIGAASSDALAHYFYSLIQYIRKDVVILNSDISLLPHKLVDVNSDDCLLVISFYRFSNTVTKVSKYFHSQKSKVIVITNNHVNPFANHCDIEFVVPSETSAPFQSRSMAFILLELFIKALSVQNNPQQRFSDMESLFTEFDVFKYKRKHNE